nr:hypothetical protein [Tanacetum cinerariifolium]
MIKPSHFVKFPGSTPHFRETIGGNDAEARSSRSKRSQKFETVEEVLLPQAHHEFLLWGGCNNEAKSRMGCDVETDDMLRIKLREAETNEEIFTSVPWIRGFNIKEPIYAKLCHEFIQLMNLMNFHGDWDCIMLMSLRRMDLMCIFKEACVVMSFLTPQEYWLSISREENLGLLRSHTSNIRSLILRVINKMITCGSCQRTTGYDKIQKNDLRLLSMFNAKHQNGYANVVWLITRWMKRKASGTQKESQICCGQFIKKIARKARVLTNVVLRSLSALIYCRDLVTTTERVDRL